MDILYVAHKYDYGDRARGLSFEHHNFYDALVGLGHRVAYFDFPTIAGEIGADAMNRRLVEIARADRPALLFAVVSGEQLDRRAVRTVSEQTDTATCNWFCDDHWRFESFTRQWAPCFNHAVTTAACALPKYARLGLGGGRVIKSQWACNPRVYRPTGEARRYDVTFVGQPYGNRLRYIEALRAAGVDVRVWGRGWPSALGGGRLSQEEMIGVFNASRINLNFSASSTTSQRFRRRRFVDRHLAGPLRKAPGGWRVVRRLRGGTPVEGPRQVKGRTFEVPGCRSLLLSEAADELPDCYTPGSEVAVFEGVDDLVERVRHYLARDEEREAVARAGYERTMAEHTYGHRFAAIFEAMGLGGGDTQREAA